MPRLSKAKFYLYVVFMKKIIDKQFWWFLDKVLISIKSVKMPVGTLHILCVSAMYALNMSFVPVKQEH